MKEGQEKGKDMEMKRADRLTGREPVAPVCLAIGSTSTAPLIYFPT